MNAGRAGMPAKAGGAPPASWAKINGRVCAPSGRAYPTGLLTREARVRGGARAPSWGTRRGRGRHLGGQARRPVGSPTCPKPGGDPMPTWGCEETGATGLGGPAGRPAGSPVGHRTWGCGRPPDVRRQNTSVFSGTFTLPELALSASPRTEQDRSVQAGDCVPVPVNPGARQARVDVHIPL